MKKIIASPISEFFPEPRSGTATRFLEILDASWNAYQKLCRNTGAIPPIPETLQQSLKSELDKWEESAKELEQFIHDTSNAMPSKHIDGWRYLVEQMRGRRQATLQDNLKLLYDSSKLHELNPFLENIKDTLISAVTDFAQVKTHCQHLKRCITILERYRLTTPDSLERKLVAKRVIQTLSERRGFDPQKNGEKLLFELENNLFIRDKQLVVTDMLLEDTHFIGQLNMGEGKTSVIMPLLILNWAKHKQLTRVLVPESLVGDMAKIIEKLSPTFGISVYLFPFSREISGALSIDNLTLIKNQIVHCKNNGDVILMTPEQALSMRLTIEEWIVRRETASERGRTDLADKIEILQAIDQLIDVEVVEEADHALRLLTELNYTLGVKQAIDAAPLRFKIAMDVISLLLGNKDIQDVLKTNKLVTIHKGTGINPISFQTHEAYTPELKKAIAKILLPKYLPQLANVKEAQLEPFITFVCNPDAPNNFMAGKTFNDTELTYLRGLRCWLASEVCPYIFSKRHNVNYGILDRRFLGSPHYRLTAVPFNGTSNPTPKSSFAHPDVMIGFTTLSYLYTGLSQDDISQLFTHLDHNIFKKHELFATWRKDSTACPYNTWEDIPLNDPSGIKTLTTHFAHNIQVIGHFLLTQVFPNSGEYEYKLCANSDTIVEMAKNRHFCGFTATMGQAMPGGIHTEPNTTLATRIPSLVNVDTVYDEIHATDGKSLAMASDNDICSVVKKPMEDPNQVLDRIIERLRTTAPKKVHAVLDRGALITGMSNQKVAHELIKRIYTQDKTKDLKQHYTGVVYFDDTNGGAPMIAKRDGDHTYDLPYTQDLLPEKELLTYFNDSHTRGTDRKLPLEAVGILTLGKNLHKDDFVQAAGRLRQWGDGQSLEIWVPQDVEDNIRTVLSLEPATVLTGLHVYAWTFHNTIQNYERATLNQEQRHNDVVAKNDFLATDKWPNSATNPFKSKLSLPYSAFDAPDTTITTNTDTQSQTEIQQETEREAAPELPARYHETERDWNYAACLDPSWKTTWRNLNDTDSTVLRCCSMTTLFGVDECPNFPKLYVSQNFWRVTFENIQNRHLISDRCRPVTAYLELCEDANDVIGILLSGKEIEGIQAVIQRQPHTPQPTPAGSPVKAAKQLKTKNGRSLTLRQLHDITGPTVLSTTRPLPPEPDRKLYIAATLMNGSSGVLYEYIGNILGKDEPETRAKYKEACQGFIAALGTPDKIQKFSKLSRRYKYTAALAICTRRARSPMF